MSEEKYTGPDWADPRPDYVPMSPRSKAKREILRLLRLGATIEEAQKGAGVGRQWVYRCWNKDQAFKDAAQEAMVAGKESRRERRVLASAALDVKVREKLLMFLREDPDVHEAAKALRVSIARIIEYRRSDDDFARRYDEAIREGLRTIDDHCRTALSCEFRRIAEKASKHRSLEIGEARLAMDWLARRGKVSRVGEGGMSDQPKLVQINAMNIFMREQLKLAGDAEAYQIIDGDVDYGDVDHGAEKAIDSIDGASDE